MRIKAVIFTRRCCSDFDQNYQTVMWRIKISCCSCLSPPRRHWRRGSSRTCRCSRTCRRTARTGCIGRVPAHLESAAESLCLPTSPSPSALSIHGAGVFEHGCTVPRLAQPPSILGRDPSRLGSMEAMVVGVPAGDCLDAWRLVDGPRKKPR
jgi:hypothetical protein